MKRILFLCTHNSARSQIAEALFRHRYGANAGVHSAGTSPTAVHPCAIRVLAEWGIDAADQRSESVDAYVGESFDLVVTVCDRAASACPSFPGAKAVAHQSFADPSGASGTEEEILAAFRRTRDEIAAWIDEDFASLTNPLAGAGDRSREESV